MPLAPPSPSEAPSVLDECRSAFLSEIESGEWQLPVLPQVASKVMALSNDPGADMNDLATLIQRDPSLAGHVLRAANSAALGGGDAISSLQHAVTRLGMKFVANAAFAVSVKGEIFRVPEFTREAEQIWRQALAAGAFGREIARVKRLNVEGQYLCGLLHTVGIPVALQKLTLLRQRHHWQVSNQDILALALACHPKIGAQLAAAWKLPRQVAVVCEWYPQPDQAPEFEEETAMTALSHELALWVTTGAPTAGVIAENPILETLNFYPDDLAGLFEKKAAVLIAVNTL